MRRISIRQILRDHSGQAILVFSLASPIAIGAAGMAVDLSMWVRQKDSLQSMADAAALAAAYELTQSGSAFAKTTAADTAARGFVAANGDGRQVQVDVDLVGRKATVEVFEPAVITFGGLFGIDDFSLSAASTAETKPSPEPACVIALDETAKVGISFDGSGKFQADCTVWSNALSDSSITIGGSVNVKMNLDTRGKYGRLCYNPGNYQMIGGASSFTDGDDNVPDACGFVQNPMQPRGKPARVYKPVVPAKCDFKNLVINSKTNHVLEPGVYCGGVTVLTSGSVILDWKVNQDADPNTNNHSPKHYIMIDGPMKVSAAGDVAGEKVGIYLEGKMATLDLAAKGNVSLSAAEPAEASQPNANMAGLVVASDDEQLAKTGGILNSKISGGASIDLIGTVYLKDHHLVWSGSSRAVTPSRITQMIAKTVQITGTADTHLMADFSWANFYPIHIEPEVPYLSH